jgi:LPXTG-motif cell wall-anchored protein
MGPLILTLLIGGGLMIMLNYFRVLPSSPTNWYLVGGIALIASGFVIATRYR